MEILKYNYSYANCLDSSHDWLKRNTSFITVQDKLNSKLENINRNSLYSSSINFGEKIGDKVPDRNLDGLLRSKPYCKISSSKLGLTESSSSRIDWNLSKANNIEISKRTLFRDERAEESNGPNKKISFSYGNNSNGNDANVTDIDNVDKLDELCSYSSFKSRTKSSFKSISTKKLHDDSMSVVQKSMKMIAKLKRGTNCHSGKSYNTSVEPPNSGIFKDKPRHQAINSVSNKNDGGVSTITSGQREKSSNRDRNTKSLIQMAKIKRKSKDSFANGLKNLISDDPHFDRSFMENYLVENEQSYNEELNPHIHNNGNITSYESMKWKFPNSNRKREEKLRSISDGLGDKAPLSERRKIAFTRNINRGVGQMDSIARYKNIFLRKDIDKKISNSNLKRDSFIKNYTSNDENNDDTSTLLIDTPESSNYVKMHCDLDATVNVKEMITETDTQSVLLYLSETLINSAQRAETLLMQKMKDYNDLVCKDPPQKNVLDFSCQVDTTVSQCEKGSTVIDDETLKQKLIVKDNRIKKLEEEKRKLKNIIKKTTSGSFFKKAKLVTQVSERNNDCMNLSNVRESPEMNEAMICSSEVPSERRNELVQVLQLENRLLRNLVKEMRRELEQENSTILCLAKKLEVSLTQQTLTKNNAEVFP